MHRQKSIWIPGLLSIFALVLVACGGADPTSTPLPTAVPSPAPTAADIAQQDSSYLSEVLRAEESSLAIFENFQTVFAQTYALREVLITALLENGVGTPFIEKLAILETLDPPEPYQDDHRIWLDATREQVRLDTKAAEAVENDNLVDFALLNGQLDESNTRARLAVSQSFCHNVTLVPGQSSLCTRENSDFSDPYAADVNGALREFIPPFFRARSSIAFRLSLEPEELDQVLGTIASVARDALVTMDNTLKTFTPPDAMAADHDRLQSYITESTAIVAEVDRLREVGDIGAVVGELGKLPAAWCDSRSSFEDEGFKQAVAILFQGQEEDCGGAPF